MWAYQRMDFLALTAEAAAIRNQFPPDPSGEPREISQFDSDYTTLPAYTRDTLKPTHIFVHDRGVSFQMGTSAYGREMNEGLAIPLYDMSTPNEVKNFSETTNTKVLSQKPPVFRFEDRVSLFTEFGLRPRTPTPWVTRRPPR